MCLARINFNVTNKSFLCFCGESRIKNELKDEEEEEEEKLPSNIYESDFGSSQKIVFSPTQSSSALSLKCILNLCFMAASFHELWEDVVVIKQQQHERGLEAIHHEQQKRAKEEKKKSSMNIQNRHERAEAIQRH